MEMYFDLQLKNPKQILLGSLENGAHFTRGNVRVWCIVYVVNHSGRSMLHGYTLLQNGLKSIKHQDLFLISRDIQDEREIRWRRKKTL